MHPLRILHVDDNPGFHEAFRIALSDQCVTLTLRKSADEVQSHDLGSDLIVVDGAGFALAARIASKSLSVQGKLVVLSGQPEAAHFQADEKISKLDGEWPRRLATLIAGMIAKRLEAEDSERPIRRVMASVERGNSQFVVLAHSPETPVFSGPSLESVDEFLSKSNVRLGRFRIVPPLGVPAVTDRELATLFE